MQFGDLRHIGLRENDRARGVDTRRQPVKYHVAAVAGDPPRLLDRRQRVIIHDAEEALRLVLQGDVVLDRAEIVADMLATRRPRAAEDAPGAEDARRLLGCLIRLLSPYPPRHYHVARRV